METASHSHGRTCGADRPDRSRVSELRNGDGPGGIASPANGSLIEQGHRTVGSELIGQAFTKPEYFWGRLSATAPFPCNAAASGGSNYGPLHPALLAAARRACGH